MKKYFPLFLAAAALTVAGCSQEIIDPSQDVLPDGYRIVTLNASAESSDTKVVYQDDKTFGWQPGDKIGVWSANGVMQANYTGQGYVNHGSFDLVLGPNDNYFGFATYPPLLGSTYENKHIKLAMDNSYTLEYATPVLMPLVAVIDDSGSPDLQFKHVGGAVKVTFRNVPSGYHTFRLTSDKVINGIFDLDLSKLGTNSCVAVVGKSTEGSKYVDINLTQESAFNSITIYFPVPTGKMKFGVDVLLNGVPYYHREVGETLNEIKRKTILRMPDVNLTNTEGPVFIGSAGYRTIADALKAVKEGETILCNPGVYDENVYIDKNITLAGSGEQTVITSVEVYKTPATVRDLTIRPTSSATAPKQAAGVTDKFGLYVSQAGYGVVVDKVTIDMTASGNPAGAAMYWLNGTDKSRGTKRDLFTNSTVKGVSGKSDGVINGAILDLSGNTFTSGLTTSALQIGTGNQNGSDVSLSGNTFAEAAGEGTALAVDFSGMAADGRVVFGDGTADDNTADESFKALYGYITGEMPAPSFTPYAVFDENKILVFNQATPAHIGNVDYPTIQAAVDAAEGGDVITVDEGIFNEDVKIQKPVTVKGSGAGTVVNSFEIYHAAVTVRDLAVKPTANSLATLGGENVSTNPFGISINESGRGSLIQNVTFRPGEAANACGLWIAATGANLSSPDIVRGCTFDCGGARAMMLYKATARIQGNIIQNPYASYAVRVAYTGNTITFTGNTFQGVGTAAINFYDLDGSSITFGDGTADDNTSDGAYYNGNAATAAAADNTFAPAGYFDTENANVFVFGEPAPVLQAKVERLWGLYTEGADWTASVGLPAQTDRNVAIDDDYVYVAATGTSKKLVAISIANPSQYKELPTATVKEEGTFYLSCPRIIKNTDSSVNGGKDVLAVCNMTQGGEPTVYFYTAGIDAEPDALQLKIGENSARLGDTFTYWGSLQKGMLFMGDWGPSGVRTWKIQGKTTGDNWVQGRFTLNPNISNIYAYYPYPEDKNNGFIGARSESVQLYAAQPSGVDVWTASGANAFAMTEITGGYFVSVPSVQYIELGGSRYVAYARQSSGGEGYLVIVKGTAEEDWGTILQRRTLVTDPLPIQSDQGTGWSNNSGMDIAVRVIGDSAYIACVKQGVGLSLFRLYSE